MFGSDASKIWKKKLSNLFRSQDDGVTKQALEELLFEADFPYDVIETLVTKASKKNGKEQKIQSLIDETLSRIQNVSTPIEPVPTPGLILLLGVNGAGKTTTAAKLAHHFLKQNRRVMLAAADTFRAGAIDQLKVWADRLGVQCVAKERGSDPAAVVYQAWQMAKQDQSLLIADTAGRLGNQLPLMQQLEKVVRVLKKEDPALPHQSWLVLDGTSGQNAALQAKQFSEAVDITGTIITKLDGTAKGGAALFGSLDMKIPVRFISVGEGLEDLKEFDAQEFSKSLFTLLDETV
ncbi:MAG: signal recognition particle-docking protein FtsY [Bdellovibrionota bacterium]